MNVKVDEKKSIENVIGFYENIRSSLNGLLEILNINFHENNFYYQAGKDNLKALNENILEILKNCYTPREVRIKLREIEFDELETERNLAL